MLTKIPESSQGLPFPSKHWEILDRNKLGNTGQEQLHRPPGSACETTDGPQRAQRTSLGGGDCKRGGIIYYQSLGEL